MASRLLAFVALVCAAAPASAAHPARETQADYIQTGMASYYSHRFEGRRTANGETFRNDALTAAHPTYPFGTLVRVTSVRGHSVDVRITDRLPSRHAIIDLTQRAAAQLNMLRAGKERVTITVLEWGRGAQQALRRVASETPILSNVVHAIEGATTAD
jgi:rare lipoprotein A